MDRAALGDGARAHARAEHARALRQRVRLPYRLAARRRSARRTHGRTRARLAGLTPEGRRQRRNGPQGAYVPLQRPASRRRERGDPRQPPLPGASTEVKPPRRRPAARACHGGGDPARAARPAATRSRGLGRRATPARQIRAARARHAADPPTRRTDRVAARIRRPTTG